MLFFTFLYISISILKKEKTFSQKLTLTVILKTFRIRNFRHNKNLIRSMRLNFL